MLLVKGALYYVHARIIYETDGNSSASRSWIAPPFTCLFLGQVRMWECDLHEVFWLEGKRNMYVSMADTHCWALVQMPEGEKHEQTEW